MDSENRFVKLEGTKKRRPVNIQIVQEAASSPHQRLRAELKKTPAKPTPGFDSLGQTGVISDSACFDHDTILVTM